MKPIEIEKTNSTPRVIFDVDKNIFEIEGCSRPENVRTFFIPLVAWLNQLLTEADKYVDHFKDNPAVLKFKLSYFNSASAKFILDILLLLNKIYKQGVNLSIEWHYEKGDEDMLEVGEELIDLVDFNFKFVET